MIEAKSYTMVIGCGEKGAAWIASNYSAKQIIIGLDMKQPKKTGGRVSLSETFLICQSEAAL